MLNIEIFFAGFAGSASVELLNIYNFYHNDPIEFPERYRRFWFWISRIFLAAAAGGLALVYELDKLLPAFHIGASAPLILTAFARKPPSSAGANNKLPLPPDQ